jgi:hypothetical protein
MVDSLQIIAPTSKLQARRKLEAGGILELTVRRAELTGENLPEFTQSYVNVKFADQAFRTQSAT